MRDRGRAALAATALAGALACAVGRGAAAAGEHPPPAARLPARVASVVDGDTLVVELDGRPRRVRLIGVDTPESHPSRKLDREVARGNDRALILALGRRAAAFTRARLLGRRVLLELDVERFDRYGRLLAYVWLPDGTLFNATLLEEGQARLLTIPPNVRHVERFVPLERAAREARRGLWARSTRRQPERGPRPEGPRPPAPGG